MVLVQRGAMDGCMLLLVMWPCVLLVLLVLAPVLTIPARPPAARHRLDVGRLQVVELGVDGLVLCELVHLGAGWVGAPGGEVPGQAAPCPQGEGCPDTLKQKVVWVTVTL